MKSMKSSLCLRLALCAALLCCAQLARAQEATTAAPAPPSEPPAATRDVSEPPAFGDGYRIGVGDVLDIVVTTGSGRSPQLSAEQLQVSERGDIQVFDGVTSAVCLTPVELAANIKTRYLQYKREPLSVVVNVREYRSQLVAVIGAVKSPGRFELRRPIRLLELLALYANGPEDRSDGRIEVVHTRGEACMGSGATAGAAAVAAALSSTSYRWEDTRLGKEEANPYVRAGDVISLSEAPQAFIVGNVRDPRNIPLKERITLTTAIAMAGGTLDATRSDRIRIERQVPGKTSKELLVVNLDAIKKRKAEDVVLQPGDIIEVPSSTGGRILRGLLGTIAPIATQGTVRVIR
jgi:protein involved in polysaccharide export with SLBB domain